MIKYQQVKKNIIGLKETAIRTRRIQDKEKNKNRNNNNNNSRNNPWTYNRNGINDEHYGRKKKKPKKQYKIIEETK